MSTDFDHCPTPEASNAAQPVANCAANLSGADANSLNKDGGRTVVVERADTSDGTDVVEQLTYEYSAIDASVLLSVTLRRGGAAGDWENVRHENFDERGRLVEKILWGGSRIVTFTYPESCFAKHST